MKNYHKQIARPRDSVGMCIQSLRLTVADMWTMTLMAVPIARRCGADWGCAMINRTPHDGNYITLARTRTHSCSWNRQTYIFRLRLVVSLRRSTDKWCTEKVNGKPVLHMMNTIICIAHATYTCVCTRYAVHNAIANICSRYVSIAHLTRALFVCTIIRIRLKKPDKALKYAPGQHSWKEGFCVHVRRTRELDVNNVVRRGVRVRAHTEHWRRCHACSRFRKPN